MAKQPKSEKIDVEALRAALAAAELRADQATERADEARAAADRAEAEAAAVKAQLSGDVALIAHLRLEIARLTRTLYGQRSERTQRLIDQYELQLEELEASAAADALTAEKAAAKAAMPAPTERRRPSRQPFPAHLPRVRVVVPGTGACPCCGGTRLSKMGEDVTETLEVVPRSWTVIQTVRERFSCRACEGVSQAPAPFHAVPRGWAGPSLLAMVLFEKYGQHQPLNRQAERYAREGVPLSLSTLADQVGTCASVLEPLFRLIAAHVMASGRLHGDDTTVPVLAKGKTSTGRVWVYVRDDRPFGGADPPAALFHFSPDRRGEHPQAHLANWTGMLQADAYGGYGRLYGGERKPAPIIEAACWAHARRKFFELADIEAAARERARKKVAVIAPLALEAVRRMDELFAIEREVNGRPTAERLAARHERSAPIVAALEGWMRAERAPLPRGAEVARAMNYMLDRWPSFTRFLDDGRVCLSNNAAERALRGLALGRKAWLFAGSDRGGQRAAFFNSLIVTAKLNDVDPQAWLADVLGRIASHPAQRLAELLPWNWKPTSAAPASLDAAA